MYGNNKLTCIASEGLEWKQHSLHHDKLNYGGDTSPSDLR